MRSGAGGVPGGTLQLAAATVQVLSCRQRLSTLSPSVTIEVSVDCRQTSRRGAGVRAGC